MFALHKHRVLAPPPGGARRNARNFSSAFSFVNFSFAPMVSKEKWLRHFKIKTGERE
jgi:hypothetical protein